MAYKFESILYENNRVSVYVDKYEIWIVLTELLVDVSDKSLQF